MNKETNVRPIILVVEDVEETRDGIVQLLNVDGYRVEAARDERDAIEIAKQRLSDLILVSLGGALRDVIDTARRIRLRAELSENVPVVIFCSSEIAEGAEVALGHNVFATWPDNFNQLRRFIARLLREIPNDA